MSSIFNIFTLLPLFNWVIAVACIMMFLASFVLLYDYRFNNRRWFGSLLTPYLWPLITATTVGGIAITLLYSEYFLFIPCSLCWLQRIALYPQALLAIIAWRQGDTTYFPLYGMGLSVFGFIVAMYQYVYQWLPKEARDSFTPCLADGSADCAERVITMFGFVTFPLVAAATFAFLFALYLYLRHR